MNVLENDHKLFAAINIGVLACITQICLELQMRDLKLKIEVNSRARTVISEVTRDERVSIGSREYQ